MVVPAVADMSAPTVAVIGCGNTNRCDDGVGARVVELLSQLPLPPTVTLFDSGTDGMAVMYRARGARRLVIIDARAPEGAPGSIYEVPGAVLAAPPPRSLNLHDFRWDHALYAGLRIYGDAFPSEVSVYLIEAATLELGLGLSPPVEAAARRVAARIALLLGPVPQAALF